MDYIIHYHVLVFLCKILASQTIAWDEHSLPRPVITRNHRRLKGFTFNTFHSSSLVSCGLQCQRNPRCVSTNFRKVSSLDKTKGICELNEKRALSPIEDRELELDEESVYTQFNDIKKQDCYLTGCLNGGSCAYTEKSKVFNCKCLVGWCGKYCEGRRTAAGMQSGSILDSQISASSVYSATHAPRRARLHGTTGGGWLAKDNDLSQWLQVDLLQTTKVLGIATQGRNDFVQWVKEYKLQYRKDGVTFQFYRRDGDNSDTHFRGNRDKNTVVYHDLNPIIEARYIRVRPTRWSSYIAMRMELYACY